MIEIARNKHFQLIKEGVASYSIYKDANKIAWGIHKEDMCNMFLKFLKEDGDMICTVDFSEWGV